jgi:tripeptidyl-peptidase-1
VPEHLQPHIDYITPGIKLTPVVKRAVNTKRGSPHAAKAPIHVSVKEDVQVLSAAASRLPPALQNCTTNMTPACIRALYNIPSNVKPVHGNSLGLYQQGSYFAKSDVDAFFKAYAPYVPQGTYPINASIDGASYSVDAASELNTGEANIDIEMTLVNTEFLHLHGLSR